MNGVSVIITCWHKEEYLDECIKSILMQTIAPLEIILVHDGCEEPMHHINVTSIMLPKNQGVYQARHIGVKNSQGSHLLFVDADDYLPPEFIEQSLKAKTDIAHPNVLIWYVHGKYKGTNVFKEIPKLTAKQLFNLTSIVPVTSLMKREVYEKLKGFVSLPVFEDWEFWMRAWAAGFKFKKANTTLWYRQTKDSRNRQDIYLRGHIHRKVIDTYTLKDNKLCPKQKG